MDKNGNEMQEKNCCKHEVEEPEGVERMETRKIYSPAVDVLDGESGSILVADMPGVDESNVEITLEKNVLTIKGRPESRDYAGRDLIYREYGVGDFERSFTLSDSVDREGIAARIKDGVLTVTLPKAEPATKKIAVATAK